MNSITELARLRAQVATLEAENAELRANQKEPENDDWYDSGCYEAEDDDWYSSSC